MKEKTVKVWITKYWQTRRIVLDTGGEIHRSESAKDLRYYSRDIGSFTGIFVRMDTEAFETEEAATNRVITLARAKVKALRATAAKIETEWLAGHGEGGR